MLAVALDDSSLKPIEGESQTYEARYKIASSYEQSGVIRIKGEENESSYYIILYEDTDEHGKTTIKLLQLSHSDIDIVYAVEKQENNFLVKYTIEQVSKSEDNSKETTNDTAYSYKLYLSPDFQINDIVPSLN